MDGIRVESSAFRSEEDIPSRHTCDGEDVSPPLTWSPGPKDTVAYALILDDPDAPRGTWVHWVAWNIRGTRLPEHVPSEGAAFPQGKNSWGRVGYGGPCPPSGAHRYFFRIWALDALLELPATADARKLLAAVDGHVLAMGVLMGRYRRR